MSEKGRRDRAKPPRRAVYRSRVDNDGIQDTILVGEDARNALPKDLLGPRPDPGPSSASSPQSSRDGVDASTVAQERWLKENVPPHW